MKKSRCVLWAGKYSTLIVTNKHMQTKSILSNNLPSLCVGWIDVGEIECGSSKIFNCSNLCSG